MQLSDEQPYTLVSPQRRFHPHENPLFAYLADRFGEPNSVDHSDFKYMEKSEKNGRNALFFHHDLVPIDFPIFSGFTLHDLHLSVDHRLVDTACVPQRKLPPFHISLVYQNKDHVKIKVRIEHTKHRPLIYAKMQHIDGSIIHPSLSNLQKESLLLQAAPAQHLLQSFLQAHQQTQYQLLLKVEMLNAQLRDDNFEMENVLNDLIIHLTQYARYSGYYDSRIERYQSQLNKVRTVPEKILDIQQSEQEESSETLPELLPARIPSSKPSKQNHEQCITTFIDSWLGQAPPDTGDSATISGWIVTNIDKFSVLDELFLDYFWHSSQTVKPFIQEQWQRLPTKGTLLEYFTQQLFDGNDTVVRDLASLMQDTTELHQIYQRFLETIEQESTLRTERIVAAHVLYENTSLYRNVLMSKRYILTSHEDHFSGILVDLFLQDKWEVFCLYVEQGLASDTGLQLILGDVPYHAIGAIISLFCANPRASLYLEKLLAYQGCSLFPHIENLDLRLYQIDGRPVKKDHAYTYIITIKGKKTTLTLQDMSAHSTITLLRYALNNYKWAVDLKYSPDILEKHYELVQLLAEHISPEMLIKETMSFFENSFFVTSYGGPFQRAVHPNIVLADSIERVIQIFQEINPPPGQSVCLLIGMVPENANQKQAASLTHRNAQHLLTRCLQAFQICSAEEQISIIRNLNQLAVAALRKKSYRDCLALTRALIFCCLSIPTPTLELHDTLLRSIFLFCSAQSASGLQEIVSPLRQLACNYVKGLSAEERISLNRNNPALMQRILGTEQAKTLFEPPPTTAESMGSDSIDSPPYQHRSSKL